MIIDYGSILSDKKVIIFGTGKFSDHYKNIHSSIAYYIDNNETKWGTVHNGRMVNSPETLLEENKEAVSIIVASMYYDEIKRQLVGMGFKENEHFYNGSEILININKHLFEKVKKFKNIHNGKRAFIIGNGPSLTIDDLHKLKNEITFASNKIFLAFDETEWRPSYYSVFDKLVVENCVTEIHSLIHCPKFFSHNYYPIIGETPEVYWLKQQTNFTNGERSVGGFSEDISQVIYNGSTVTYINIQLAFYMGIREIYLLGVDYSYPDQPNDTSDGHVFIHEGGQSGTHFHPNYNKAGEKYFLPNQRVQYQAYQTAATFLHQHGGQIYNASRQTKLDVFPLVNFDEVLD